MLSLFPKDGGRGETNYEGAKGAKATGMVSSPISSKMNLFVSPVKGVFGAKCSYEVLQKRTVSSFSDAC